MSHFVHDVSGSRPEVLLALEPTQDEHGDHVAIRYHVMMFTQAALRRDEVGAGRVAVECALGCFAFGDWEEDDLSFLEVMQRTWGQLHGLTVYAGPDLADHGQQGLGSDLSLG